VSSKATKVAWDEADLEARLCRALDISKRAVAFFAEEGYADSQSPENSFRPEKIIAETAMLIYAASGARRFPNVAARIDELAQLLSPYARSERTLLNMALHPSLCLDFAFPHILLSKLGYRNPSVDDFLKTCIRSLARHSHERPPFGSVEQMWIESVWTGIDPGRAWYTALSNSVLHRPIDILGGLREDSYAFTHLVMYCTDFGFGPPRLPRSRSAILDVARSLLAKCLDGEDYDLAGEVVMAWPLIGASWCASATFGFRVLARVEDQVGVLPGGTTKVDRLKKLNGKERTRYAIGTGYHTACVMGLICAASLRLGRLPPTRITGRSFDKCFVDHLLSALDRDQGHWQPELLKLRERERNAVAPLLLDIALIQKCRKHDYQAASELLVMASQNGSARSTVCAQAAELLERLAAYSPWPKRQNRGP
jgi:hypothetical protein